MCREAVTLEYIRYVQTSTYTHHGGKHMISLRGMSCHIVPSSCVMMNINIIRKRAQT